MFALITCTNEELDVTLHDSEAKAEQAFMTHMREAYADFYECAADGGGSAPPDRYDEREIANWMGENLIWDTWRIKRVTED